MWCHFGWPRWPNILLDLQISIYIFLCPIDIFALDILLAQVVGELQVIKTCKAFDLCSRSGKVESGGTVKVNGKREER